MDLLTNWLLQFETDIWANMYDLPLLETESLITVNELIVQPFVTEYWENGATVEEDYGVRKHILTHQKLQVRLIKLQECPVKLKQKWIYIERENLKNIALPKIIFIFIKNIFNL